jgi:hypothetical protein
MIEVPKPGDIAMASLHRDEFRRFAISYGLSIPFGEGPDVGLPSQFSKAEPLATRKLPGHVVDYADSKDVPDYLRCSAAVLPNKARLSRFRRLVGRYPRPLAANLDRGRCAAACCIALILLDISCPKV